MPANPNPLPGQPWRHLLQGSRGMLALLIFLGASLAAFETLVLLLLLTLGNLVLNQPVPAAIWGLVQRFPAIASRISVESVAAALLVAIVAKLLWSVAHEYFTVQWRGQVLERLQTRVLHNLVNAPYSLFTERRQGDILYAVYSLPFKATETALLIPRLVANGLVAMTVGAVLFRLSPSALLVVLAVGLVFGLAIGRLTKTKIVPANRTRVEAMRRQSEIATELTGGMRELKIMRAERPWVERFKGTIHEYTRGAQTEQLATVLPGKVLEAVILGGLTVSILVAAAIYPTHQLLGVLPLMFAFGYGLVRVYPALVTLGSAASSIAGSTPHLRALEEWLTLPSDPLGHGGGEAPARLREGIELRDVRFAYGSGLPALAGVSYRFPAGKSIAIVGPSGSGKSTLFDQLLRVIEPQSGTILVDGTPLSSIRRQSWWDRIAVVDQEVFLFHGTIAENLRMARPDATQQDLMRACEQAGLAEFIAASPQGLDTVVGERGFTISGGQRQRVAIARALIRDPALLLMDEATSNLDPEVEDKILDTLFQLKGDRTLILIAHRPSTAQRCDEVVSLHQGRIVEAGPRPATGAASPTKRNLMPQGSAA